MHSARSLALASLFLAVVLAANLALVATAAAVRRSRRGAAPPAVAADAAVRMQPSYGAC